MKTLIRLLSLIFAIGIFTSPAISFAATSNGPANSQPSDKSVKWSGSGAFTPAQNASEHWTKHGSDFPECKTKADYIAAANAFVTNPPKGTLTKKRSNGDTLFYNQATNTFAVRAKSGVPRTMFKPDSGIKYWERQ